MDFNIYNYAYHTFSMGITLFSLTWLNSYVIFTFFELFVSQFQWISSTTVKLQVTTSKLEPGINYLHVNNQFSEKKNSLHRYNLNIYNFL